MKITFKDVGQGDSIILEWETEGQRRIGIIDCNLKGLLNPVLKHLVENKYTEIEFIILSHPHRDHFSGLLQLLTHCEKQKIQIRKVAHTLLLAGKKYWKYFEVDSKDTKKLNLIIKKLKQLKASKIIRRIDALIAGVPLKIVDDVCLECLAPSHDDVEAYQNIVKNDADKNMKEASQAANYLSTIFRLNFSGCCVLFTSDAENTALEGVIEREQLSINKNEFHLCQLPHHGSANNHYPGFWNMITTSRIKHAIISAGKHRTYNHPSFEVIKAFDSDGYIIHCTNILNGMKEYVDFLETLIENTLELDSGSKLAEEYRISNDRCFIFKEGVFESC